MTEPSQRPPSSERRRLWQRKWVDAAICLPLLGLVLLATPLVEVLAQPISDPLVLFGVWGALILACGLHSRARPPKEGEKDS
ncbi:MAG: hypothetical protein AAGA78_17840 [Pseudomonadota bacterium]